MGCKKYYFLSILLIIVFSSSLLFPDPLWAAWEDDFWDKAKEPLKITGIVAGATVGITLLIAVIAGTLTDIKGDEIYIQNLLKKPAAPSNAIFSLINKSYTDTEGAGPPVFFKGALPFVPLLYKPLFSLPYPKAGFPGYTTGHDLPNGHDIERQPLPLFPRHIGMEIGGYRWDKVS